MSVRIAIVNSSSFGRLYPRHVERLRALGDVLHVDLGTNAGPREMIEALRGVNAIVAGVSPVYSRRVFEELPELLALVRHGIGYDNVDVAAASDQGVAVAIVPGLVEQEAVAEHSVALMLSLCRHLLPASAAVKAGRWSDRRQFIGFELRAKRIALIGIGNIGRRVAEILRQGFRAEVVAYDPYLAATEIRARYALPVSWDEAISSSDIISLHCSLTPETRGLLSAGMLERVRRGVLVVNTARGELIDEPALIAGLRSGQIGGYAADVLETRGAEVDHPLLTVDHTLVVPHLGSYTQESLEGMGEFVVQDLEDIFLRRKVPRNLLNPASCHRLERLAR